MRARVEQRQLPVVHRDDAIDPSGGHASLSQGHLDVEEDLGTQLVAAVAFRLNDAKEAGAFEIIDGLGRMERCASACGARSARTESSARPREKSRGQVTAVSADVVVRKILPRQPPYP